MSNEVAALEAEVKEYKLQLETVALSLQNDPENTELQSLKSELDEVIALTESAISELKPAPAPTPVKSSKSNSVNEKWSRENHPAFKAGNRPSEGDEDQNSVSFGVNDTVLARWKSGDGGFYNARITSITGSSANPVYIVSFKNYGTTETCYAKDIRPLSSEAKKRKADNISGSSTPISTTNANIISAAPTVDPTFSQPAKKEPSLVSDGPIRPAKIPKKVKAKTELEAGKAKWQDFANKGKNKFGKKDSMFRTGESVTARGMFARCDHDARLTTIQLDSLVQETR